MIRHNLTLLFFLVLLIISSVLTSCWAPLYVANPVNTPMLKNKNQLQAKGHITSGDADLQSAFAVTDHIGIMANYLYSAKGSKNDNHRTRNQLAEIGAGLFFPSPSKSMIYEIYSGYGRGYGKHKDWYKGIVEESEKGNYNRFFVQQNFGVHALIFDFVFSTRASYVSMYEYQAYQTEIKRTRNKSGWFLEPAYTVKFGKIVKVYGQITTVYAARKNQNTLFDYERDIVTLGIEFNLFEK